jgi:hypothetical protein
MDEISSCFNEVHTFLRSVAKLGFKITSKGGRARGQIVDIPIAQWQLTTLEKED